MNDLILDQCLEEIRAQRATVADCLAKYPDLADELKPLLTTAAALEAMPEMQPSVTFKQTTRARLLQLRRPPSRAERLRDHLLALTTTRLRFAATWLALVLLLVGLIGGVAYAANDSLPDSPLYPIKRAAEQLELTLAPDPTSQARVRMNLADRRLSEMKALTKSGQSQLMEQVLNDYTRQISTAISILPPPTGSENPVTQEFLGRLTQQQQELRAIPAPSAVQSAVQNALVTSQKGVEKLLTQPNGSPASPPQPPVPNHKPTSPPVPLMSK